jgi:hypothetical protein
MKPVTTNANAVFDAIKEKHGLLNDAALVRKLETYPSAVSSMRSQLIPLGAAMQRRILEKGLLSARRLKALLES